MVNEQAENKQQGSLNLHDLLVDEQTDMLSEYLSISIENLGEDTKVSIITVEDSPTIYSSTLSGVSFTDFQYLVDGNIDSVAK